VRANAMRIEAELVPIADRLRSMQIFRVVIAAAVLVFGGLVDRAPLSPLLAGSSGYVALTLAGALAWRAFRSRGLLLFGAMLIFDGVYIAWVTYLTGGTASPLRGLVVLHLIAVALLASYRTGLKLAMWHSLLLLVVFEFESRAQAVTGHSAPEAGTTFQQTVTFIGVFWLVVLSTATFSAVNERELRRRRYDLEALAQLATDLEQVTHPKAVADVLLGRLVDSFGFSRAVVVAPAEVGSRFVAGRGVVPAHDPTLMDAAVATGAIGVRETLLIEQFDPIEDKSLVALMPDARNLLVLPLLAEGGAQGVLIAEHALRAGSRIERRVVAAVERFAAHGALSLRTASLHEAMERMASTDPLTGIANRRTFEQACEGELARSSRMMEPVALVILDIDNFKKLNDTLGHREGDRVLQSVASVLRAHTRSFDTAARYGGEEFVLVLPRCSVGEATRMADRVREAIAALEHPARVTVSAGVAAFPVSGNSVDSLVRAADAALYQSKRDGRNRVTAAGGVNSTGVHVSP
jgi:two-component system, cell cycle response regulator